MVVTYDLELLALLPPCAVGFSAGFLDHTSQLTLLLKIAKLL